METYNRPDLGQLAFAYKDPVSWFIANEIAVPTPVPYEKGQFRVKDFNAWYLHPDTRMGRSGYPNTIDTNDSFLNYNCEPLGVNVFLKGAELKNPAQYGYPSAQDMIQRKIEWESHLMKIDREARCKTFVDDDTNFNASNILTLAGTDQWSDLTNSDPLADIMDAKALCKHINTMVISDTTARYLQQHPKLIAAGFPTAPNRSAINPWISAEFMQAYFNIQRVIIGMGQKVANSQIPDTVTLGDFWDDACLLFHHNPAAGANPDVPTWARMFYMSVDGTDAEGWIVKETMDERAGLFGGVNIDVGYYIDFAVYAEELAVRIDGTYS